MNQIPDADATTTATDGSQVHGRLSLAVAVALVVSGWAVSPVALSAADAPAGARPGTAMTAPESRGEAVGVIVSYRDGTTELQRKTAVTLANMVLPGGLDRGLTLGGAGSDRRNMEALDLVDTVPVAEAESVARLMEAMPFVERAEPNHLLSVDPIEAIGPASTARQTTNTHLPIDFWGLDRIDQRSLPLDDTYEYDDSEAGSGVLVYVFDTGIRADHLDFDFGVRVKPGVTTIDDGNGTNDCHGHGTHVAGTIGGTLSGVAKDATLVPVRVLNCAGQGTYGGIIAAIDWVIVNHPADTPGVANFSLGGNKATGLNDAIEILVASGITVVAAAGNDSVDSCTVSPASAASAITVGAATRTDGRASFSNFGSCNDIYAPGTMIWSAHREKPNLFGAMEGTSMAAPHVAGVVARMLSADPGLTPAQISARLGAIAAPFASDQAGDANKLLHAPVTLGSPTVAVSDPGPVVPARTAAFDLTFSRAVTGLSSADVAVAGTARGCSPTVAGDGADWTVTVSCASDGTVTATLAADSVADADGITGPFAAAASAVVTLDAPPSATLDGPGGASTSRAVEWTVTFDEPVTGLSASGFGIAGTATPCSLTLSGSGADYAVRAECDNDGTATLTLLAGAATDATGNTGPAANVTSTVTISAPAPTPPIAALFVPALLSTTRIVVIALQLSHPVAVSPAHFSNAGTARNCTFVPAGSGTQWNVTAICGTDGTLIVRFDPPTVVAATALPVMISSPAPAAVSVAASRITPKALARLANVTVPAKSRIRAAVSKATSRNCRVVGSRIVRTRPGRCAVTLTVSPPKGRAFKKKIVVRPAP